MTDETIATIQGYLAHAQADIAQAQALLITQPVITVGPGEDVQAAIDAAPPGSTLALARGASYRANLVIHKPLTLTSQGTIPDGRAKPGDGLAVIKALPGGAPAIAIRADDVSLIGLECDGNPGGFGQIIEVGDSAATSVEQMPTNVIIDRCYLHGDPVEGQKGGVQLNSRATRITRCYISDIKRAGQDAWGIGGGLGPGPYWIEDNFIEASGCNIIFGGVDPLIQGLIPTGITVKGNTLFKPNAWGLESWQIKNLFELKAAKDVLVENNTLSGSWANAQTGYAVLFNVRNQDGAAPWNTIQNLVFRNNVLDRCGAGIQILGRDDTPGHASVRMNNVLIEGNDITLENYWGPGRMCAISGGPDTLRLIGNTGRNTTNSFLSFAQPEHLLTGFEFVGNDMDEGDYGITGDDAPGLGVQALDFYAPSGYTWLNNVVHRSPTSGRTVSYPPSTTFL